LGIAYGPDQSVRLSAATDDPIQLKADTTWYMTTNFTREAEGDPAEVSHRYCWRDWIEHSYKPAKHELGWADFQGRPERAIVRHGQRVMLAFTFSLLAEAARPPATETAATSTDGRSGGKITGASRLERDLAPRAPLVVPVGAAAPLLAPVVHRAASPGARRPPRPRRSLAPP
jgi:hypothetical protein